MPAPKPDRAPTGQQNPPRPGLDPLVAKELHERDEEVADLAVVVGLEVAELREQLRRTAAVLAFIVRNGPFPEALAAQLLAELGTSFAAVPGIEVVFEPPDGKPH
jgi:hypothetical protein